MSSLRSLVDYEDDKDYKPPPRKQPETSEEDDGVSQAEETLHEQLHVTANAIPGRLPTASGFSSFSNGQTHEQSKYPCAFHIQELFDGTLGVKEPVALPSYPT
ncbi:hypothetical protein JHK85_029226 [Glycine max]|nr:hypothetical protein JHK85_029226 [Glycine max]